MVYYNEIDIDKRPHIKESVYSSFNKTSEDLFEFLTFGIVSWIKFDDDEGPIEYHFYRDMNGIEVKGESKKRFKWEVSDNKHLNINLEGKTLEYDRVFASNFMIVFTNRENFSFSKPELIYFVNEYTNQTYFKAKKQEDLDDFYSYLYAIYQANRSREIFEDGLRDRAREVRSKVEDNVHPISVVLLIISSIICIFITYASDSKWYLLSSILCGVFAWFLYKFKKKSALRKWKNEHPEQKIIFKYL